MYQVRRALLGSDCAETSVTRIATDHGFWELGHFAVDARVKYLQLADKAARRVMMLTERLDHHRGRGQQQITVKHVTTNNVTADQAIIAESVTTGGGRSVASPALLAANSEAPMPILDETRLPDPVGAGGGQKKK